MSTLSRLDMLYGPGILKPEMHGTVTEDENGNQVWKTYVRGELVSTVVFEGEDE